MLKIITRVHRCTVFDECLANTLKLTSGTGLCDYSGGKHSEGAQQLADRPPVVWRSAACHKPLPASGFIGQTGDSEKI